MVDLADKPYVCAKLLMDSLKLWDDLVSIEESVSKSSFKIKRERTY